VIRTNINLIEKVDSGIILAQKLSVSEYKQYLFPKFLRLTQRVTTFSPECEICRDLQVQIDKLSVDLPDQQLITNYNSEDHIYVMKVISRHLKESHGLVGKSYYVKRYVLLGLAAGITTILLGLILLCFGITQLALDITMTALITRAMVSYTVGYFLDRKAKKQGRVL
jgi:hypothetical protein